MPDRELSWRDWFAFGAAVGAWLWFMSRLGCIGLAVGAEQKPGVVILCQSGGVFRPVPAAAGFLASGGRCALHDEHGGHVTVESIVVYEDRRPGP